MRDRRTNKRSESDIFSKGASGAADIGPYEAIIVSHLDPYYGGALEVELLKVSSSGNTPEKTGQLIVVNYLSPFYGVTPLQANGKVDQYNGTQKSYGFWAVPPDVGSRVLVIFAEGRRDRGFWIGCIQDRHMNFMVPDGRAASAYNKDGSKQPVGEFNKLLETQGDHPTAFNKPINVDYANRMYKQGLDKDETRGLTTTSARRNAISNVYGWSTPGPVDKRQGAPRVKYGTAESKVSVPANRLGGSSFVMDDGDETLLRKGPAKDTPMEYANVRANETTGDKTLPANELTRLRTRTGHQILLHNTEDLIYISHGSGDTWIELSANGKIDIYAKDSISIRSATDLNFTADRDINFTAIRDINTVVGRNHLESTGAERGIKSGTLTAINAGTSFNANAQTDVSLFSEGDTSILSQSQMALQSSSDLFLGSRGTMNIDACPGLNISSDGNMNIKSLANIKTSADGEISSLSALATKITSGQVMGIKSTGASVLITGSSDIHLNGPTAPSATAAIEAAGATPTPPAAPQQAKQTTRRPAHEPWYQHENLNPQAYTADKTEAGLEAVETFVPPTPDTFKRQANRTGTNAPLGATGNTAGGIAPNGTTSVTSTPGGVTQSNTYSGAALPTDPPEVIADKKERSRIFAASLRTVAGFNDEQVKAAIACANSESQIDVREESSYGGTSNERIRSIFSAARSVSDAQLTEIKKDKFQFFELVYGKNSSLGPGMGNTRDGDGGNYIGRGLIQLTGKGNYERYGFIAGLVDPALESEVNPKGVTIVDQPGLLLSDFKVSCDVAAAYLKERYRDRGRGVVGNMRMAIAGTERGYDLAIGKDNAFVAQMDDTWIYNSDPNDVKPTSVA